MPRFIVSVCDLSDGEHSVEIITAVDKPSAAILHSWIPYIYKDSWVAKHLAGPTIEDVTTNFSEQLGWSLVCRNLDSALMNVLNDGDSSVSTPSD